jgi:hypothetical protein
MGEEDKKERETGGGGTYLSIDLQRNGKKVI